MTCCLLLTGFPLFGGYLFFSRFGASTSCAAFQRYTKPMTFKSTVNLGATTKLHLEKGVLKNTAVSYSIVEKDELKSTVNVNFVFKGYKSFYSKAFLPKMIVLNKRGAIMVTFQEPKQEEGRNRFPFTGMFNCLLTEVIVEVPSNYKWDEIVFEDEEEDQFESKKPQTPILSVPLDEFKLKGFYVSNLRLKGSGKIALNNINSENIYIEGNYTDINLKSIDSLTKSNIVVKSTGGKVSIENVENAESILIENSGPVVARSVKMLLLSNLLTINSKSTVSTLLRKGSLKVNAERNVEIYLPRTFETSFTLKSQKRTFQISNVRYHDLERTQGTINCRACPSSIVVDTKRDVFISDERYLK